MENKDDQHAATNFLITETTTTTVSVASENSEVHAHSPSSSRNKMSTTFCMINMIKGFFGTAILAMPKSMNQAGLWSGVVTLFIFGAFANYTMRSLVYQKIELERQGKTINSYGGLGRALYGRWGARAAHFAVISSQLGFCCSYLLFISETLADMFPTPFGTSSAILTKLIFLLIVIPIPLGLVMLRGKLMDNGLLCLLMIIIRFSINFI